MDAAKARSHKNQPPKPQTSTWADRVKVTEARTRFTLDPIPRCVEEGKLEITADMLSDQAEQWDRCMVGFFPGFRMNYHTVNTVANRIWKSSGLESVMSTSSGFWLFRFQTEEQMQEVLERGPWMFGGKTMVLQQWHPGFSFDKNRISKLPAWIRIHGLPFSLWSRKGLSAVASKVGRPLSCDEPTYCCTRLDYARVCVELDAAEPYTTNFEITTPFSKDPLRIDVEYEWRPARCDKCRLFGHVCPKEKLSEENKEKEGKEGSAKAQEEHEPLTKASAASEDKQNEDNNPQEPQTKVSATEKSAVGTSKKIWSFMGQSASEDHIPTGDARRVQKGKMKEGDTLMCIVNQMDPLLNQSKQGEEESSVSSTAQGSNSHTGDTSPTAFTKVRKKGGSKKNKGATRL